LTLAAGSVGSIQWQSSASATTGFVDIPGATTPSFTVTDPISGANYFKVKFTSGVCTPLYSTNTIAVYYKPCVQLKNTEPSETESTNNLEVLVYPNPFDESISLELNENSSNEKVFVNIFDITGKLVQELIFERDELNYVKIGSDLVSGSYQVRVSQGENMKMLKIIKR